MFRPFTLLDWFVVIYYLLALIILALMMLRSDENEPWQYTARIQWGWLNIGASLFTISFLLEVLLIFAIAAGLTGKGSGILAWTFIATLFLYAWSIWPNWRGSDESCIFFPEALPRILRRIITLMIVFSFIIFKIYVILAIGNFLFASGAHTFAILILLASGLMVVVGGYHALVRMQIIQNIVVAFGLLALIAWVWFSENGLEMVGSVIRNQSFLFPAATGPLRGALSWSDILGLPVIIMSFLGAEYASEHRFLLVQKQEEVRGGLLFSTALRIVMAALLLFPVLLNFSAYSLLVPFWPDIQAPADIPSGLSGLALITVIAALVSSLSHSLSSGGLLLTQEIYRPLRRNAAASELTLVGRLSTTGLVLCGLILIPFFQLHLFTMDVFIRIFLACLCPPLLAFFTMIHFRQDRISRHTWLAILPLYALSVYKTVLDYAPGIRVETMPFAAWMQRMHFLEFAAFLFAVSLASFYLLDVIISRRMEIKAGLFARPRTTRFTSDLIASASRWHVGITVILLLAITSLWLIYFFPLK